MAIVTCGRCGAKNRVDERAADAGQQAVCGRCGTRLAAAAGGKDAGGGKPETLTDETFEREVLGATDGRPVLVDCWAAWCGPCRMIAPSLDQLAAESGGRYRVAKLNVDENPQTADRLRVRSIPALFIFKNGDLVDQMVGVLSKEALAARLAQHV
ncbi:MAG TPA: thioredoxin [Pyrinomonadaceae bacterium]|nr:thioredoxin [Pyrinomonadaceae bacterium]